MTYRTDYKEHYRKELEKIVERLEEIEAHMDRLKKLALNAIDEKYAMGEILGCPSNEEPLEWCANRVWEFKETKRELDYALEGAAAEGREADRERARVAELENELAIYKAICRINGWPGIWLDGEGWMVKDD